LWEQQQQEQTRTTRGNTTLCCNAAVIGKLDLCSSRHDQLLSAATGLLSSLHLCSGRHVRPMQWFELVKVWHGFPWPVHHPPALHKAVMLQYAALFFL
jgi:hypothetical protein